MSLVFEWDPRKARSNYRNHGVSFAEAVSVFSNPLARIFPDEEHSAEESREIVIGHSERKHLLLVPRPRNIVLLRETPPLRSGL